MRLLFFIFFIFVGEIVVAQTKSDSLYFTKLYPLDNGEFILIGSESPVSFRKSFIRHYNSDLKLINQIYKKKGRIFDMNGEFNYPSAYRITSRYRWNKGHVYLYDKNLHLISDKFFKRDDYKAYQEEIMAKNSPLNKSDNILGLESVVYTDSLYYQFIKETKTIIIGKYDVSKIKLEFKELKNFKVSNSGDIVNYKFKIFGNDIIFYYSYWDGEIFKNCFYKLNDYTDESAIEGTNFYSKDQSKNNFVSDFSYNEKLGILAIAGNYSLDLNNHFTELKGMDGYFIDAFNFPLKNNEIIKLKSHDEKNNENDLDQVILYKVVNINFNQDVVNAAFEKFVILDRNDKKVSEGSPLKPYLTYTPVDLSLYQYNSKDLNEKEILFNYDYSLSKEKDKQWRVFNYHSGQTFVNLQFNGITIEKHNDHSLKFISSQKDKFVYSDRNSNYFIAKIINDKMVYEFLMKEDDKNKAYFFDNYYVKYSVLDYGYKLEKVNY